MPDSRTVSVDSGPRDCAWERLLPCHALHHRTKQQSSIFSTPSAAPLEGPTSPQQHASSPRLTAMVQKHVLDAEDFSKWRFLDCHDAGRRLLVFDPNQQTSRALLRAIHQFWTLDPTVNITWHFSTEACNRPTYGRTRHDLTDNQTLNRIPSARRPLSDLTEASWAPQHVGRLNIILHFDPPSPKSTSAPASGKRMVNSPYAEIEFAGFEAAEILPYSATALQRLAKIRADKAKRNVKAELKQTPDSMEDVAMTDAETSESQKSHDGAKTEQPSEMPSLSIPNNSRPIIPPQPQKRSRIAKAAPQHGMQDRSLSRWPAYTALAGPRPMEMNGMPALRQFQSTTMNTSSPVQQRYDNSLGTFGPTTNPHFNQGPMHFPNWMGPPANTFLHNINASGRSDQNALNPTPFISAPTSSNPRGGIADAIRRRSKASLGFGARAMQSPRSTQDSTGGFGLGTNTHKPYDLPIRGTDTDMTDNHSDLDRRMSNPSRRHANPILLTNAGTVLREVSDADYERVCH
ncbi:uncharacterized protein MYCFIDRAFT_172692 [Pseudocercospora fijiensis CIRAD86]|uniref:Uncharacterized protein n=1 Tax=Pseudocercospora fijiensis (strain CIRAD86) TaxID=383855 RepID=M3A7F3_PSEFD|nr:uncharacterized protein MYCFIDRAFT_172692 [Pseudocercospora fijiensis CIRAD86]EME87019.1 hypothetical protein MYCFIDRAFT_172692 [Pseudocercospora fijiensis CIRAD86]